jgi:predicted RNA-binding protein with RPS1 domain
VEGVVNKFALDCSKCGAPLEVTETTSLLDCPYCKTKHRVETVDGSLRLVSIEKRLSTLENKIQDISPKSIKQIQEKMNNINLGDVVSGTVIKNMEFAVLIEIEPEINGFVHISQLSIKKIRRISDVINIGDEVKGIVYQKYPDKTNKAGFTLAITPLPILENWPNEKTIQHLKKLNKKFKG